MPHTGEKPGKGTYICTNCHNRMTLDEDTDSLPPCPKCHKTDFVRAGWVRRAAQAVRKSLSSSD